MRFDECNYWARLPLDADGWPINIGDVMVNSDAYDNEPFTVGCMTLYSNSWTVLGFSPNSLHHYSPAKPTVEDVLREFSEKMNENMGMYTGEAIDADEWRDADRQTIAEYAARLRLADDSDKGGDTNAS